MYGALKALSVAILAVSLSACGGGEKKSNVEKLVASLKSTDEAARGRATAELVSRGEASVPALVVMLSDPDPAARRAAATTLWGLGSKAASAVPQLASALSDQDAGVRMTAAMAIAVIGPAARDAVPALIQRLTDADRNVRLWVVKALGEIGPAASDALPVLERLHKNDYLGGPIRDAMLKIRAGVEPTPDPKLKRIRMKPRGW
jgi:HEAT repeat protein